MTDMEEFKQTIAAKMQAKKELTEKQYAIGEEILDERDAQDRKWGEQNHPNGTGPYVVLLDGHLTTRMSRYFKPLADQLTENTNTKAKEGTLTYADIFLEEVFEALAEVDPSKLRAELIQALAVGMAWIEKIDRDHIKAYRAVVEAPTTTASGILRLTCPDCGRAKGCNADCEDMNCDHCYCGRDGRDG